ncbi:P-loop containing nucleoside triphosphate hydrolase protein [Gloeopeniophorella convolvens]|nr:P-loop containing nucleoside triphosphate hydrolase protein [Gloeopeniophorella convolvens]
MSPGSSPKAQLGAASKNYCPPSPAAVTAANQTNQVHKVSKKYNVSFPKETIRDTEGAPPTRAAFAQNSKAVDLMWNMKGDVGPEAAVKKAKREKKVTVAEEIESASKDAALEEPSDNEPAALEVEFEKEKWRKDKKIFKKAIVAESASLGVDLSGEKRKPDDDAAALPRKPRILSTPTPAYVSPADTEASFETSSISVHLPPSAPPHLPLPAFDALAVPVASSGAFPGFSGPTPVQPCAWPPALTGRDIIGIAETGSGNALVFGIPALTAPSAEARRGVVCRAALVVGAPGCVLNLVRDGVLVLGGVEYVVLDVADRVLDKGFEGDIRAMIGYTLLGALST